MHVGTEHILLAVLRDKNSAGARLLSEHGSTARGAAAWIIRQLDQLRRRRPDAS
ncbi:MAG: Clp protease N-terminal domain-containing protein [Acidimicrobiales bacterium]